MKRICVIMISIFLISCNGNCIDEENYFTMQCEKQEGKIDDNELMIMNYKTGYVVIDDLLKREIHVKEYLKDNFVNDVEYRNFITMLQESYVYESNNDDYISAIMPYYEKDKIIYPYRILDYTDLSNYTEKEIPNSVRTKDKKAIVFDLYWEYIQENGLLDGFSCTLDNGEE